MSSPSKPPRSETQPVSRSIQKHSSLLTSLYAVVMAGGYGVRLWPESRRRYPKPFLKISTGQTLLSQTFERLNAIIPNERKILITGQSMAASARKAAPFLREEQILQEPQSKNTTACIGWAAVELLQKDPDAIMLVLPSDHLIRPPENFCATVIQAVTLIQKDSQRLVTLGIPPASPATSYGYIEAGKQLQPIPDLSDVFDCLPLEIPAFAVRQFREKPSREKAMEFLNSGRFFWNSGVFVWKAQTILDRIRQFEPALGESLLRIQRAKQTETSEFYHRTLSDEYGKMKNISIDYAVLEHAKNQVVLKAPFFWDDLGSFAAWERINADQKDAEGNLVFGTKFLAHNAKNNLIRVISSNSDEHLVVLSNVDDLIVVQTENITLILPKNQENQLKRITESLSQKGLENFL